MPADKSTIVRSYVMLACLLAGAADVNRGLRLARRGALEEALAVFERAARRSPALAEAHLNRGLLLPQQGRREEALRLRPGMAKAQALVKEVER